MAPASGAGNTHGDSDTDPLHDLVLERLAETGLTAEAADLILAGLATTAADNAPATTDGGTSQAYLRGIGVAGFRGIGHQQELKLNPGPGLTLVVGRNGSGKSSFAEALEFALTGDSYRWKGRPATWREGWRNLHVPEPCSITIGLALDSAGGTTKVVRSWAPDADLADSTGYVQPPSGRRQHLSALGWERALELYRPFLTYTELGSLLNSKPTELHDSIQNLLGLDRLVALEDNLKTIRKSLQDQAKRVPEERTRLQALLVRTDDPRAAAALSLLEARTPDLEALGRLATGEAFEVGVLQPLRQLAGLTVPSPKQVRDAAGELRDTSLAVRAMAESTAETARRRAQLLRTALEHHVQHGEASCPVCGQGRLDDDWRTSATAELERLQAEAQAVEEADTRLSQARRTARALLAVPPVVTALWAGAQRGSTGAATGITGLDDLATRWSEWSDAPSDDDGLVTHLEFRHPGLVEATEAVRSEAGALLAQADDAWRPCARSLAAWVDLAASAEGLEARLRTVKQALDWLRKEAQVLRDERLAPFAGRSRLIWQQLRQQSNVELGALRLDGLGNRRQLRLDVAVDEKDTGGLGVMSQGELHALGLALFLPRATAAESPFRFVVIDDPVQAMDPSKVDGLAKVLVEAAETHQVVVFSHDDRLPEAIRRLQLPATIQEVVRRENSEIELRQVLDPIQLYLDDARAIAMTKQLTAATRVPVIAGLCRSAIEAACHRAIRRRDIGRGLSHAEVEERLAKATTLSQVAALCLFGDSSRTPDVPAALTALDARGQIAFRICDQATHGRAEIDDPMRLITAVGRLVNRIGAL